MVHLAHFLARGAAFLDTADEFFGNLLGDMG